MNKPTDTKNGTCPKCGKQSLTAVSLQNGHTSKCEECGFVGELKPYRGLTSAHGIVNLGASTAQFVTKVEK